jgi:hypothetical protein
MVSTGEPVAASPTSASRAESKMEIDAGLCRLRPYRMSDRDSLLRIANDREV